MQWVRRLFDFYLSASIHVAIAVCCLLAITGIYGGLDIRFHLYVFVFGATVAAYNFIKYGVEAEKYIRVAGRYQRTIQVFSFLAAGLSAFHLFFLDLRVWMVAFALVVLVGLYALPLWPYARNLRNLGFLKVFIVSFVWAGTTVVLPVVAQESSLPGDFLVEAVQRFLLVVVMMLPFEVRDMETDRPDLGTIPQRIGVRNTRYLGWIGVVVFFALCFLKENISGDELLGKGLMSLLLGVFLWQTRRRQSRYFASFWVEALPIFWLGVALALRHAYFSCLEI